MELDNSMGALYVVACRNGTSWTCAVYNLCGCTEHPPWLCRDEYAEFVLIKADALIISDKKRVSYAETRHPTNIQACLIPQKEEAERTRHVQNANQTYEVGAVQELQRPRSVGPDAFWACLPGQVKGH